VGRCGTHAITRRLCARRSRVRSDEALRPRIVTSPPLGRSRRASRASRVDLPLPDGPVSAVTVCSWNSASTPRSAWVSPVAVGYIFTSPDTVAAEPEPLGERGAGLVLATEHLHRRLRRRRERHADGGGQ